MPLKKKTALGKSGWQQQGTLSEREEIAEETELEATRQRVRELRDHPAIVAALQEYEQSEDPTTEETAELLRRIEAGEFRREALIRRYGQRFVDALEHPGGE